MRTVSCEKISVGTNVGTVSDCDSELVAKGWDGVGCGTMEGCNVE